MKLPTLRYEKQIWKKGFRYIGGIDEVGRGAFAGPVVAAAVVFRKGRMGTTCTTSTTGSFPQARGTRGTLATRDTFIKINDSKKLTKLQREKSAKWIKENALAWGIGEASAATINRLGLVKATGIAFRKAIKMTNDKLQMTNKKKSAHVSRTIDYLLIDAFYIPYVKGLRRKNQLAIIKGDTKSISIAAASIIAKVYRDNLMEKIGKRTRYKRYDWISNKGYGTKKHRDAIKKHGVCGYHRKLFVNTYLKRI